MILAPLGLTLTLVAFGLSIAGIVVAARSLGRADTSATVRHIATAVAITTVSSAVVMEIALITRDFSVAYVAEVGSRATPLLYTIAALWSAQAGSLILWAAILSLVVAWFLHRSPATVAPLLPLAMTILFAVQAFFLALLIGPTQPWARISPVPADGPGPNPLLQNHPLMVAHPPLLYLGFIALVVPFALTIAALVARRIDAAWLGLTRAWVLGSWVALAAGLVLGAWWSYAVLGWGGYWAWDPVENVALLPWLTATAFLHSAMVQRRRGELVTWNVLLVLASFVLVIVGTLITRSGILESVHAFARTAVGPMFALLLAVVLVGTAGVLLGRLPREPVARAPLGVRGTAFVLNNLLLAGIVATVFAGTLAPLAIELVTAERVSVGAPYFERVVGPVAAALVILLAAGPSLPWGRWHERGGRTLAITAAFAVLGATVATVATGRPGLFVGLAVAAFALVHSLWLAGGRLREARAAGPGPARTRGRRAVGGLVAHAGIGLAAIAIVAVGSGRGDASDVLSAGETLRLGSTTIRLEGLRMESRPDRSMVIADTLLQGPAGDLAIGPSLSVFPTSGPNGAVPTPAIVASPLQDVYVTLLDADPVAGTATLRVSILPLMSWLWVGGGMVALGGLLATPIPFRVARPGWQVAPWDRSPVADADDGRAG
ncbi:MAG: heme lyase CcmF/NrfE family subunit [Candidatus Limnocylindria bacterium]